MAQGIYNMTIEQGSTFSLSLVYKDAANKVVDLSGYSARMQVRSTLSASTVLLEVTTDSVDQMWIVPSAGQINIKLPHSVTALLAPSIAVYDLELESSGGEVIKLIKGKCRIEGEVTR
jgi:hypothetical protein